MTAIWERKRMRNYCRLTRAGLCPQCATATIVATQRSGADEPIGIDMCNSEACRKALERTR
jgi:hypothetical protein